MNAQGWFTLCLAIACVGTVVDVAESLVARAAVTERFVWPIVATTLPPRLAARARLRPWGSAGPFTAAQVLRASLAVTTVASSAAGLRWVALGAALGTLVSLLAIRARLRLGQDGADRMQTIIWTGAVLSVFNPPAALTLLAGQLLLSYVMSGVAKLAGGTWRSGSAPRMILATASYGSAAASRLPTKVIRPVALVTIAFEVASPALILGGVVGATAFVVLAVGFHVSVAMTLGLNDFLWAFGACLPAVVWVGISAPWA